MSKYRKEMNQAAKDTSWTFWRFLPITIVILGILALLRSVGLFGGTIIERKVFENSYQRSEALKSQIATDEAVLVEIERKLSNTTLDENTRTNLEAQAAAARLRIATAKSKQ